MVGIKGKEVPKSCSECSFKYYDEDEDVLCCALEDGYISDDEADEKRLECCPLVETEERKKGHWKHGYSFPDGNYAKCTACGEIIKCTYPMHFCPNCGADMREATNEINQNS